MSMFIGSFKGMFSDDDSIVKKLIPATILMVYSVLGAIVFYFAEKDGKCPMENFWAALYFVGSVYTTIGYGNVAPCTVGGRVFMIFYTLVAIPISLISLDNLGQTQAILVSKLWRKLTQCCNKWRKSKLTQIVKSKSKKKRKHHLPLPLGFALTIFWLLICALFFSFTEGWNYFDGFYYTFVSITTIGFGDLNTQPGKPRIIVQLALVLMALSLFSMCINIMKESLANLTETISTKLMESYMETLMAGYEDGSVEDTGKEDVSPEAARQKIREIIRKQPGGRYLQIFIGNSTEEKLAKEYISKANLRVKAVQATVDMQEFGQQYDLPIPKHLRDRIPKIPKRTVGTQLAWMPKASTVLGFAGYGEDNKNNVEVVESKWKGAMDKLKRQNQDSSSAKLHKILPKKPSALCASAQTKKASAQIRPPWKPPSTNVNLEDYYKQLEEEEEANRENLTSLDGNNSFPSDLTPRPTTHTQSTPRMASVVAAATAAQKTTPNEINTTDPTNFQRSSWQERENSPPNNAQRIPSFFGDTPQPTVSPDSSRLPHQAPFATHHATPPNSTNPQTPIFKPVQNSNASVRAQNHIDSFKATHAPFATHDAPSAQNASNSASIRTHQAPFATHNKLHRTLTGSFSAKKRRNNLRPVHIELEPSSSGLHRVNTKTHLVGEETEVESSEDELSQNNAQNGTNANKLNVQKRKKIVKRKKTFRSKKSKTEDREDLIDNLEKELSIEV